MERMTRTKDKYECRFLGGCPAEVWIEMVSGLDYTHWSCSPCDCCPFEKYINRLAEMEDKMEEIEKRLEDDGK